jgi:hypothetical protein
MQQPAKKFFIISRSSRENPGLSFTWENHLLLWFYVILRDYRLWIARQRDRDSRKSLTFTGKFGLITIITKVYTSQDKQNNEIGVEGIP